MDEPNERTEETPAETTAETAEEKPSTEEKAQESPPWGDDFDAQRAWNTITSLRDEVKEAKQGSQEHEQAQQEALAWRILASSDDDEQVQAAAEFLGVELEPAQADPDEEGEFVDPVEQRLEGVEEWAREQEEMRDLQAFDGHLDDLAKGAEVKLTQRDRRVLFDASQELGFSPESTEKAFEDFLAERKDYDKEVIERYRKSKNAPHVAKGGSQATEDVLPLNATPSERQQWMTERFQMGQQQS